MAITLTMANLTVDESTNSPLGSDSVTPTTGPDDYIRNIYALIRREQAQATNTASAATVDLGAIATGSYVHITGTTTITSFGTVAAGISRVLVFDGALTLTHNATSLILPGGANITTAAGDVFEFRSEGSGNWRCTSYLPAVASLQGLSSLTITIDPGAAEVTGSSYQNLNNAFSWLANKRIKAGATVTLSCVAGTHNYSASVTVNHPDGDRINIVGAAAYVSAGAITLTRSTSAPGYGGASSETNCVLTASAPIFSTAYYTGATGTITGVNATTDVLTVSGGHNLKVNQLIVFAGTVPAGITAGTEYVVLPDSFTGTDFKVSLTMYGTPVNITDATTGATYTERIMGQGTDTAPGVGDLVLANDAIVAITAVRSSTVAEVTQSIGADGVTFSYMCMAKTVLAFSSGGLLVSTKLGGLHGLTLRGAGKLNANTYYGALIEPGAKIENMYHSAKIENFYQSGIFGQIGSDLLLERVSVVNCGSGTFLHHQAKQYIPYFLVVGVSSYGVSNNGDFYAYRMDIRHAGDIQSVRGENRSSTKTGALCRIVNGGSDGAYFDGSQATLNGLIVRHCNGSGLSTNNGATVHASGALYDSNRGHGLYAVEQANVFTWYSTFTNNGSYGLYATNNTRVNAGAMTASGNVSGTSTPAVNTYGNGNAYIQG